jgi:hypothetical protein
MEHLMGDGVIIEGPAAWVEWIVQVYLYTEKKLVWNDIIINFFIVAITKL